MSYPLHWLRPNKCCLWEVKLVFYLYVFSLICQSRVSPSGRGLGRSLHYPKGRPVPLMSLHCFSPKNFDYEIFRQFFAILPKIPPKLNPNEKPWKVFMYFEKEQFIMLVLFHGYFSNDFWVCRLPIQNHLKLSITAKRWNVAKHSAQNSISLEHVKKTSMPNPVESLEYIKCYSLSMLTPMWCFVQFGTICTI